MLYNTNKLIQAINQGNLSLIKKIVKFDPDIILNCEEPILHYAIELGDIKIIEFLITKGININYQYSSSILNNYYENGETVLHYAIKFANLKVIKYLIQKGCDVNLQDIYGNTPLHLIIWNQRKDIQMELIELFLHHGALVNIQDRWGNTAFHLAVWQGNLEIVAMLFSKGVDLKIQDKWGNTALHIASKLRNKKIISFLVLKKNNPDFNIKDKWGNRVIEPYINTGEKIVKSLLRTKNQGVKNDGLKKSLNIKEEKTYCGCCFFF